MRLGGSGKTGRLGAGKTIGGAESRTDSSMGTAAVNPVSRSNPAAGGNGILRCGVFGGGASAGEGQEIPAGAGVASRGSLAPLLVANSRLAKVARLAALGADNFQFDHEVVGSPDHQKMFDIVASNNDELALPVEVEGIDSPKPRRPGPSITRQPKPASEGKAENKGQQSSGGEECDRRGGKGETLAREKTFNQAWHLVAHSKKTAADVCLV